MGIAADPPNKNRLSIQREAEDWDKQQLQQLDSLLKLPEQLTRYPRAPLLFPGPSPIQRLSRVTADIAATSGASGVNIWIKREDCNSPPFSFGGNKARKLEYIIPDVISGGYDTLVTCGGRQSNCMRQVAAAGALYGLDVKLVEEQDSANWGSHSPKSKLRPSRPKGNVQISELLRGKSCYTTKSVEQTMANLAAEGKKPYFIPVGASAHPLGGLGYARCAFEIVHQEEALGVFFDTIVLATLSGSTSGGLLTGFKLAALQGRSSRRRTLLCVYTGSEDESVIRKDINESCYMTAEKLAMPMRAADDVLTGCDDDVVFKNICHGGKYGVPTERTVAAMKYAAAREALLLDPVYTGKAFEILLDMVGKGTMGTVRGSNVLFVHTGGQQVLGAYSQIDFS